MKKILMATAVLSLLVTAPMAQASVSSYNVTTTWYEPDTQPNNSIFKGSFSYDSATHTVSNLVGLLSESMDPANNMNWLALNNQLVSWYDSSLNGTFAATFLRSTTNTFMGNVWTPQDGIDVGGVFAGGPSMRNYASSVKNAYALIFVPDDPLTALTQSQLDKVAYADCAPGGMMGATCMTGTSVAGYGAIGTMSGVPLSQVITAAVPEPETYAMFLAGLGLMGGIARRRRNI